MLVLLASGALWEYLGMMVVMYLASNGMYALEHGLGLHWIREPLKHAAMYCWLWAGFFTWVEAVLG